MYKYNEEFYSYINKGSLSSARIVIPLLLELLPVRPNNILDVGCGVGAWLSIWKEYGCAVQGVDGDYIENAQLLIQEEEFRRGNLKERFSPDARFDLVQCLEVAEHLPGSSASELVGSLCECSDLVVFSAAAPGQGGENHVNEQPYSYWRDLFEENGYQMYDLIRDRILGDTDVMPWYQYNMFLYVNKNRLPDVHSVFANCAVNKSTIPEDKSPLLYRLRKRMIRILPYQLQTKLAVIKKTTFNIKAGLK